MRGDATEEEEEEEEEEAMAITLSWAFEGAYKRFIHSYNMYQ